MLLSIVDDITIVDKCALSTRIEVFFHLFGCKFSENNDNASENVKIILLMTRKKCRNERKSDEGDSGSHRSTHIYAQAYTYIRSGLCVYTCRVTRMVVQRVATGRLGGKGMVG